MNIIDYTKPCIFNMFTENSFATIGELDLAVPDDILLMRTSRTATFTIGSSSSSSSSSLSSLSSSNQSNHLNGQTTTTTTTESILGTSSTSNSNLLEDQSLRHSESLTIDSQQRRPIIHDPYCLSPNLQVLNDWMIVSCRFCFLLSSLLSSTIENVLKYLMIRHVTNNG